MERVNKIRPSVRTEAVSSLLKVQNSRYFLQDILQEKSAKKYLNEKDQRLLYEITQGVIRHKTLLDYYLSQFLKKKSLDSVVRIMLQTAFYQAIFLVRIPPHAVISETMKSADEFHLSIPQKGFLRAVLSGLYSRINSFQKRALDDSLPDFIRYSHPKWLINLWTKRWGQKICRQILSAGTTRCPFWIFPNPANNTFQNLIQSLQNEQYPYKPLSKKEGIAASTWNPVIKKWLENGKAYIQSPHQYASVHLCPAQNNQTILEIGAAPGGKTIFLNHLAGKKGLVYSIDKDQKRMELLQRRIRIMNLDRVIAVVHDLFKSFPDSLPADYDHVVLDAPCSNLAELSRRPEIKWRISPDDLDRFQSVQRNLVKTGWLKLKPQGSFLYMTCTLTQQENQNIRDLLLTQLRGTLLAELETIPTPEEPAGGYACLVRKNR
ncbi:MAG: hypothetical protein JW774_05660 [Candidatus Aureabacteria bacterium]|nr:hypothetical protein [Candidatus Auribacterota bacterium]